MKSTPLAAALLLLLAGAAAAQTPAPPPDTLITLDRGACERRCAVYGVTIAADGTVTYRGRHFVRVAGTRRSRITPAAVAELVAAFDAASYYQLADRYAAGDAGACETVLRDAPIAKTSITSGGRSKSVVHDHRCRGPVPDSLTRLEDLIDRAANAAQWIK